MSKASIILAGPKRQDALKMDQTANEGSCRSPVVLPLACFIKFFTLQINLWIKTYAFLLKSLGQDISGMSMHQVHLCTSFIIKAIKNEFMPLVPLMCITYFKYTVLTWKERQLGSLFLTRSVGNVEN